MFCRKCGTQLPDESLFCPQCGSQIRPNGQASYQGGYNSNGQSPYQNGYQQTMQTNPYFDQPAPKKNNVKKKIAIVAIVAAAAIAAVILLYLFVFSKKESTVTPEATIEKLESALNDLNMQEVIDCFDVDDTSEYSDYLDYDLKSLANAFGMSMTVTLTPGTPQYYTENSKEYCTLMVNGNVSVSYSSGSPQNTNGDVTFTLVKTNGQWLIDDDSILESLLGSFSLDY